MSASTLVDQKAQPETVALFVSDLHLSAQMPRTAAAFFRFLNEEASTTRQLYLLGDIFEYWAGDDDLDDPFNRKVVDALRALTDSGVALYWMAGNRDFLVGDAFAQATGMRLLPDPYVADIGGQRMLLVHGDAQCTDDKDYMEFRSQVRNPAWQSAFLAKPLAERKMIIQGMREGSRDAQREKSMAIMDVNTTEIARLFDAQQVDIMIHGHTHRPGIHREAQRVRYVLSDWDCDGDVTRGGWIAADSTGQLHVHTLR
ncbi:MAG: UDP-2,3-diacylglucosamine diphosphatase [Burkholderiales bacterium]|nr:UDP-2,3-diacylglucosamine diphosphatase [Burkholderiales bacterium]